MDRNSRAPKLTGDFGEGLASYALIRKGFEVAVVDHVGADLIAQKGTHRIAVSVKTRRYQSQRRESQRREYRAWDIEQTEVNKVEQFARRFALEAVCLHIACVEAEKTIHLFMMRTTDIKALRGTHSGRTGYRLGYDSPEQIELIRQSDFIDYSHWSAETIGSKLFSPESSSHDDDAYE